jgi:hypothetical protein
MRAFSSRTAIATPLCLLVLAIAAAPATATTKVFEYSGGEQTFVVPDGVHAMQLLLIGGRGGEGGAEGGSAAEVGGEVAVTPGETLYLEVAGNGRSGDEGGGAAFNGGAAGGTLGSGGGGGASDVRRLPRIAGLGTDTRIAVAAGGGGGGGDGGGFLGGVGGGAGSPGQTSGANGGGGAGTMMAGGNSGSGCNGAENGTRGSGGKGGAGNSGFNGGGGGGGGYFGGGGGAGACGTAGGGGGGGSSLVPSEGFSALASRDTEPVIALTYTAPPVPPAPTTTAPATGATPTTTPPPTTKLGSHPPKIVKTSKMKAPVKFTFSAEAGATFRCKVDKGAYAPCASPKRFRAKLGRHRFTVQAVRDGSADPTPATFSFKVVKKAQKR